MRVAVASSFSCGLGWWSRLADEGHDVRVWIEPQTHKTVGDGLVPKAGQWPELLTWAKEGALLRLPTLVLFDSSGLGEKADEARAYGLHVVGGGSFCDRLEKGRSFGFATAQNAGATLPPYQEFTSFDAAAEAAKAMGDVPTFFKSDRYIGTDGTHGEDTGPEMAEYLAGVIRKYGRHGECILQEKVEGVPLSTARWWNGLSFVGPYELTYENKKLMNGDIGPATGCSFNAVWFSHEALSGDLLGFESLALAFRRRQAPPGLYDMNAIVTEDGRVFFLEFTPRLGYDSEMTSFRLLPDLGDHLWSVATGLTPPEPSSDLAYSVRLAVPPYPWEHGKKDDKGSADGIALRGTDGLWNGSFVAYLVRKDEGEIVTASPEGIVGLSIAVGDDLEAMHDETMDFARSLKPAGSSLMWRSDGDEDVAEAAQALADAGLEVHPGLLA